jgi:hypothetical protein
MQLPCITDLLEKGICPVFSQFPFLKWSIDGEEPAECAARILQTEDITDDHVRNQIRDVLGSETGKNHVSKMKYYLGLR